MYRKQIDYLFKDLNSFYLKSQLEFNCIAHLLYSYRNES